MRANIWQCACGPPHTHIISQLYCPRRFLSCTASFVVCRATSVSPARSSAKSPARTAAVSPPRWIPGGSPPHSQQQQPQQQQRSDSTSPKRMRERCPPTMVSPVGGAGTAGCAVFTRFDLCAEASAAAAEAGSVMRCKSAPRSGSSRETEDATAAAQAVRLLMDRALHKVATQRAAAAASVAGSVTAENSSSSLLVPRTQHVHHCRITGGASSAAARNSSGGGSHASNGGHFAKPVHSAPGSPAGFFRSSESTGPTGANIAVMAAPWQRHGGGGSRGSAAGPAGGSESDPGGRLQVTSDGGSPLCLTRSSSGNIMMLSRAEYTKGDETTGGQVARLPLPQSQLQQQQQGNSRLMMTSSTTNNNAPLGFGASPLDAMVRGALAAAAAAANSNTKQPNGSSGSKALPASHEKLKTVEAAAAKRLLEHYKQHLQNKQPGKRISPHRLSDMDSPGSRQMPGQISDPGPNCALLSATMGAAAATAAAMAATGAGRTFRQQQDQQQQVRSSAPGDINEGQHSGFVTNPMYSSTQRRSSDKQRRPASTADAPTDHRPQPASNLTPSSSSSPIADMMHNPCFESSSGGGSKASSSGTSTAAVCGAPPRVDATGAWASAASAASAALAAAKAGLSRRPSSRLSEQAVQELHRQQEQQEELRSPGAKPSTQDILELSLMSNTSRPNTPAHVPSAQAHGSIRPQSSKPAAACVQGAGASTSPPSPLGLHTSSSSYSSNHLRGQHSSVPASPAAAEAAAGSQGVGSGSASPTAANKRGGSPRSRSVSPRARQLLPDSPGRTYARQHQERQQQRKDQPQQVTSPCSSSGASPRFGSPVLGASCGSPNGRHSRMLSPSAAAVAAAEDALIAASLPGSPTWCAAAAEEGSGGSGGVNGAQGTAAARIRSGGGSGRPEQVWLDSMLTRLGKLPEDALLEVIHRLVEVRRSTVVVSKQSGGCRQGEGLIRQLHSVQCCQHQHLHLPPLAPSSQLLVSKVVLFLMHADLHTVCLLHHPLYRFVCTCCNSASLAAPTPRPLNTFRSCSQPCPPSCQQEKHALSCSLTRPHTSWRTSTTARFVLLFQ